MMKNNSIQYPDPFGDDDVFDIYCGPATKDDLKQVAFLALGLLNKVFGYEFGQADKTTLEEVEVVLQNRLRLDSTWVMHEGETVIGVIDLLTSETLKLNGLSIPRAVVTKMGLTEKVQEAGLLPLLVHEPEPDEAHQSIVALLPGSRGEGRGTLLLMHGAFWSRAQGKNWMTVWLPSDDQGLPIYERRGYRVMQELESHVEETSRKWLFLRRPISPMAYKELRMKEKGIS